MKYNRGVEHKMNLKACVMLLVLALVLVSFTACSGADTERVDPSTSPVDKTTTAPTTSAIGEETKEDLTKEGFLPLADGQVYSPYSGLPMPEERISRRPLAVMFDNLIKARPQKGLDQADIVYEVLVEGLITRYMAIYHATIPGEIGPIRSARPYFVRLALENDGYYSHIGGSNQAFADIVHLNVADLDGMNVPASTYWRKSHKPKPNNMYSSGEVLYSVVSQRKYRDTVKGSFWTFGIPEGLADAEEDLAFKIVYKAPNAKDSVGYFVEFVYNDKATLYERSVNGKPHVDEGTGEQLTAKSIIIQRVKTKVIDDVGRLEVSVVGSGDGYYMYAGKRLPITWEKTSEAERTQFYDAQGQPLVIAPGQLWIQLVPSDFQLLD